MFQSQAQTEPEARVLKFTNAFKKKNTQLDRPNGGIWIYMQGRNNHDVEDKKRKKVKVKVRKKKGNRKKKKGSSQRGKE